MFIDMAADYLTWDNTTAVRYELARAVPATADVPAVFDGQTVAPSVRANRGKPFVIPVAKNRNLTQRELAASGGVYTGLDQVYLLPDALFPPGIICKPGDAIIELAEPVSNVMPKTRWTVLEFGWTKNRWTRRLTCRDLVLAFDLRDNITIERPVIHYNAAGAPIKRFPSDAQPGGIALYQSLPARIQLVTKEMADERGIRGLAGKYEVIVGQEVDVTSEDRIILPSGDPYLDIVGYRNAQRIDELPVILAERRI